MTTTQNGILAEETRLARYLFFTSLMDTDPRPVLQELAGLVDGESVVLGLGQSLLLSLDASIAGMRDFQAITGKGVEVPSTPMSLLCWLRGDDRGQLLHRGRAITQILAPAFELGSVIDSFQYDKNRDLTGYEDGTENPKGDEAIAAAVVQGQGKGMDGSSFMAIQQWLHDLDYFDSLSEDEQDDVFGRRRSDNEEFDEAPEAAHAKRAAQESFEPEAFLIRRSMPWADGDVAGLMFVAFGKSFDAYEAILKRMTGQEDGITDNLFRFTRPLTGSYFWCPPMARGHVDLSLLQL
jgi:putative iron-dependent peroxidase